MLHRQMAASPPVPTKLHLSQALIQQAIAADLHHWPVQVGQNNPALFSYGWGKQCSHIAGATGQIEYSVTFANAGHLQHHAFEQAVGPQRHQVVHEVVTASDRLKNVPDFPGFFIG